MMEWHENEALMAIHRQMTASGVIMDELATHPVVDAFMESGCQVMPLPLWSFVSIDDAKSLMWGDANVSSYYADKDSLVVYPTKNREGDAVLVAVSMIRRMPTIATRKFCNDVKSLATKWEMRRWVENRFKMIQGNEYFRRQKFYESAPCVHIEGMVWGAIWRDDNSFRPGKGKAFKGNFMVTGVNVLRPASPCGDYLFVEMPVVALNKKTKSRRFGELRNTWVESV